MAKAPVRRRTQAERREETRARILTAAVNELKKNSYGGFRVDKVAVAAKVSRGAQTHHFPTKESLALAALETIYQDSAAASLSLISRLRAKDDVLGMLLEDTSQFFLGHNFAISMSMLNSGEQEQALRKKVRAMSRKYRFPIEKAWLEALTRSGLAEEHARTILNLTQSIYRGMMVRKFLVNDPAYIRFTIAQWSKIARAYVDLNTDPI